MASVTRILYLHSMRFKVIILCEVTYLKSFLVVFIKVFLSPSFLYWLFRHRYFPLPLPVVVSYLSDQTILNGFLSSILLWCYLRFCILANIFFSYPIFLFYHSIHLSIVHRTYPIDIFSQCQNSEP